MTQTEIELGSILGSGGFVFSGTALDEQVGASVSILEDINGDGIADMAFGTPSSPILSGKNPAVHIVFGRVGEVPIAVLPSELNGSNGFTITGSSTRGNLGFAVRSAGDFNGDGLQDLVIGAPTANPKGQLAGSGQSFVIFGRSGNQPFPTVLDVDALNSTDGFAIDGAVGDRAGASVSTAGDINGDNIDDLIIGAPDNNRAYLVYGQAGSLSSRIDLAQLDSSQGMVLTGVTDDFAGSTVRNIGDFNNDGFDDVAIAAPTARTDAVTSTFDGRVYVLFGGPNLPAQVDLTTLNGSNGFVFQGTTVPGGRRQLVGSSIDGAGDFNGDGFADLIIGARGATPGDRSRAGQAYVVYGRSSTPAVMTRESLNGSNGLIINGVAGAQGLSSSGDSAGAAVSGIGDFNQDGIDDVMVLAPNADVGSRVDVGRTFVVYGRTNNQTAVLELSSLAEADGFALNGINQNEGGGLGQVQQDGVSGRLDGGGDVNGDGVPDILIGAPRAELFDPSILSSGAAYVFFSTFDVNNPVEPPVEPPINPPVGPPIDPPAEMPIDGTQGSDRLVGSRKSDTINGLAGDDHLIGKRGNDVLNGGQGDDRLVGKFGADRLNGDEGNDRLFAGRGDDVLNGGEGDDDLTAGWGKDILNGGEGNDHLFASRGDDVLNGGEGDDDLTAGWGKDILNGGEGNDHLFASRGDDVLNGGEGDDDLTAGWGKDILNGGEGNDHLFAGRGNDVLNGGEGDDEIWGGAGDDVLRGGLGNDTLTGDNTSRRTGSDTFVLAIGEGLDAIVDFKVGTDLIGLADGLTFSDLSLSGDTISAGNEMLATLVGVNATGLSESSFIIV